MCNGMTKIVATVALAAGFAWVCGGCSGRTSLLPNPDPTLRKTTEEFAADAAKRFPYRADAPRGPQTESPAAAQVRYGILDQIEIVNTSDSEDYADVEVWVNRRYVAFLPKMEKKTTKRVDFRMLYNECGKYFAVDKTQPRVEVLELYKNGKMYPVDVATAD